MECGMPYELPNCANSPCHILAKRVPLDYLFFS